MKPQRHSQNGPLCSDKSLRLKVEKGDREAIKKERKPQVLVVVLGSWGSSGCHSENRNKIVHPTVMMKVTGQW